MDIETFRIEVVPQPKTRKSKLNRFTNEILTLKKAGYSLTQIMHCLELNGVITSKTNLSVFIRSRLKIEADMVESNPVSVKKISYSYCTNCGIKSRQELQTAI